jgi:hypothetical protein
MTERRGHYIPTNAAQFKEFMRNIIMYVEAHTGAGKPWANIPVARAAELRAVYMQFDEAFDVAMETPTHPNIMRRQEAQAAVTTVLRAFVNQFLRFPPVTNPDRAEMGIPNHDFQKAKGFLARSLRYAQTPHIYSWSFAIGKTPKLSGVAG